MVKEGNYDTVILATGGVPAKPPIPGIDGANVVNAVDILAGKAYPGMKALVIDGGVTGAETSDYLGEHGIAVTVLEMRPDIALDEESGPKYWLMQRLAQWNVQKVCNATVKEFTADGVIYTQDGQEKTLSGFDTIVLAMGVKSYNPLEEALKDTGIEIKVIGDAAKPGKANNATEAGLAAALSL